jgi:hypothetical protein
MRDYKSLSFELGHSVCGKWRMRAENPVMIARLLNIRATRAQILANAFND